MQHGRTLIASVSCLILAAGIAQADVTTFTGDGNPTGIWNDIDNWDNGIPDEDDRAVIPEFKTCNIDADAEADTIDVQGTLVILGGFTLTLDNDSTTPRVDPIYSVIDGLLTLAGDDSVLEFIDADHGIIGDGEIHGNHNNARIEIEAGLKFTSRLSVGGITGAMTIKGIADFVDTGTFRNDGLVWASGDGAILKLHEDTILEDHSTVGTATWTCGGGFRPVLLFSRNASLNGDFGLFCDFNNGRINIGADIDTCGNWEFSAGRFNIFANKTFRYGSYSGSVTNPGTAITVGCLKWTKTGSYDVTGPSCG